MKRTATLILFFIASVTSHVQAQQEKIQKLETEIANEWNRLQDYVGSAQNAVSAVGGLELTEDQYVEFQKFLEKHELLKLNLRKSMMQKNSGDRLAAMIAIQTEMNNLGSKLDEDILLPHQVKFLRIREFDRFLLAHGGDVVKVMKSMYGEDLKLSEDQQKKVDEALKLKTKESEEAHSEFVSKMKAINEKYRETISSCLSDEQKAKIEKRSNQPIIPAGKSD